MMHSVRRKTFIPLAITLAAALAGCGGDTGNPLRGGGNPGTVVVGSADFPENVLLAEIYAQALEAKGVKVERKLNIGSREVLFNQIQSGGLSVLPEYNGALLAFLDPRSAPTSAAETNQQLTAKLPATLRILNSSAAEDKDSLTVTAQTAAKYRLKSVADLAPVSKDFAVGGPPQFRKRYEDRLATTYGVRFAKWVPDRSNGQNLTPWLKSGKVQAANLFTTSPAILINNFVVLEDPKHVFGFQNITPLVNKTAATDTVVSTLNAVSARLDTTQLLEMMKQVVEEKEDPADVAKGWLAMRTAG